MNFDLLATIFFILLFVVGPLLQRGQRGQQRRPPPGRGTRPGGREAGAPPPRPDADREGPLSERLEEARRRVLEAMGEQPRSEAPTQPQPAPRGAPSRPDLDWQRGVDWQQKGVEWQEVVKPVESFMTSRQQRSSLRGESGQVISAPPLRTERRRKPRRTAKLAVGQGFGTSGDAILNGIIWHEILSEPVSRRGNRRQPSRLRSR